ncbi:MAG: hypothetical protein HC905_11715 [Bacteroidales bacterium]|nr:hypothetical protein [Bacteroidales bacterium]
MRNKCIRLWTTAVFTWESQLISCCYDKDATYTFAYNRNETFEKIWKGEKFMRFREQILKNKSKVDICCNCGG